jgi:hypothetical protein
MNVFGRMNNLVQIVFMVEPCILRSIDGLSPTTALNVNFI